MYILSDSWPQYILTHAQTLQGPSIFRPFCHKCMISTCTCLLQMYSFHSTSPRTLCLLQMYYFRNTGPRIPTPQHHSRNHDGGSDASETIMNPDGSIRSGKKRKAHDNVATSYMGLPVGAPTSLVAHARCELNPFIYGLFLSTSAFDFAFDYAYQLCLLLNLHCKWCRQSSKNKHKHICMGFQIYASSLHKTVVQHQARHVYFLHSLLCPTPGPGSAPGHPPTPQMYADKPNMFP